MIRLPGNLCLKVDRCQYIVYEEQPHKIKDDIRIDRKNSKYYTSFARAMEAAIQQSIRNKVADGEITDLRDIHTEHNRLVAEFKQLIETPLNG